MKKYIIALAMVLTTISINAQTDKNVKETIMPIVNETPKEIQEDLAVQGNDEL